VSLPHLRRDAIRELVDASIAVIESEQAPSGAYPACPTFPVYRFAWFRDGAFTADGVGQHGRSGSAQAFHEWAAGVVTARRDRIEQLVADVAAERPVPVERYLPTRFALDGTDSGEQWWDFQLDGYGTWLWALQRHLDRTGIDAGAFAEAIGLTTRYLAATWSTPCYDWWEEHPDECHVATLLSIHAGLRAAVVTGVLDEADAAAAESAADAITRLVTTEGSVDGRLRKWLGSREVDASSLAAAGPYANVSTALATSTVAAVEAHLLDGGGVHRYRADVFYGGGRWPVLAALLGQAYLRLGRRADALDQLSWMAGTADAAGRLPEQVSDRLLAPDSLAPWQDRWGPVAQPLLWSHGGYLALAADLGITS